MASINEPTLDGYAKGPVSARERYKIVPHLPPFLFTDISPRCLCSIACVPQFQFLGLLPKMVSGNRLRNVAIVGVGLPTKLFEFLLSVDFLTAPYRREVIAAEASRNICSKPASILSPL